MSKIICLLIVIMFTGCHVVYTGYVVNETNDTLLITTKPSLLNYYRDEQFEKLEKMNVSQNDSFFQCFVLPHDTLKFNSAPAYGTSLQFIDWLEIRRGNRDKVIFTTQKLSEKQQRL